MKKQTGAEKLLHLSKATKWSNDALEPKPPSVWVLSMFFLEGCSCAKFYQLFCQAFLYILAKISVSNQVYNSIVVYVY